MNLSDVPNLDPAVRKTIKAYLEELEQPELAVRHVQSDPAQTLGLDSVLVATDSGLLLFTYSLPEGGGCELEGRLTVWRDVAVSHLGMATDWKPNMPSVPQSWTLALSRPLLTLSPVDATDTADFIAFARLILERVQ